MNWDNMTPYFKKERFDCRCGCGKNNMDEGTMNRLLIARTNPKIIDAGIVFIIRSGCRCEAHNEKSGGGKASTHLRGHGVDIVVANNEERYLIHEALKEAGFQRFGFGSDFIHADDCRDADKTQKRIWLYK